MMSLQIRQRAMMTTRAQAMATMLLMMVAAKTRTLWWIAALRKILAIAFQLMQIAFQALAVPACASFTIARALNLETAATDFLASNLAFQTTAAVQASATRNSASKDGTFLVAANVDCRSARRERAQRSLAVR